MLTYSADETGKIAQFHAAHYGARALGGAGLIVTETLAVSAEGRMAAGRAANHGQLVPAPYILGQQQAERLAQQAKEAG